MSKDRATVVKNTKSSDNKSTAGGKATLVKPLSFTPEEQERITVLANDKHLWSATMTKAAAEWDLRTLQIVQAALTLQMANSDAEETAQNTSGATS